MELEAGAHRYLVISSDCHAGPEAPVYRYYLDSRYRDQFDDELRERQALIEQRRAEQSAPFTGDADFQQEWLGADEEGNSLHEVGMRGGWDAPTRDKELDADGDGRSGVPQSRRRHRNARRAVRRGLRPRCHVRSRARARGARAYNRWAAELCSQSPERRAGLIVAPTLGDIDGAIAEIRRAHGDGLRGIIIPPRWGGDGEVASVARGRTPMAHRATGGAAARRVEPVRCPPRALQVLRH